MTKLDQKIITKNWEETADFASAIAGSLHGGETLALSGQLGGGKTTFTKGLAQALGVVENVTSPTFVMMKVYPIKIDQQEMKFVHIDAYRTESIEDIKSVGIEDYLDRDDVIMVVEWAEKIKEIMPQDMIKINFKFIDENTREILVYSSNYLK